MTTNTIYFKNSRSKRRAMLQNDFSSGMMFSSAPLSSGYAKLLVNYDLSPNSSALTPRAGIRTSEVLVPETDTDFSKSYYSDPDLTIMDALEFTESNGKTYRQLILGKVTGTNNTGEVYVVTSPCDEPFSEIETIDGRLADTYSIDSFYAYVESTSSPAAFSVPSSAEIHNLKLANNTKIASIVGSFAYSNSFYFIDPINKSLKKTKFDSASERYKVETVTPINLDPTEAVTYGYNMLLGENAYNFTNQVNSGAIELTGILPYSGPTSNKLVMTPKPESSVTLRCFFEGEVNQIYRFVWEWREISSDSWTSLVSVDQAIDYKIVLKEGTEDEVCLQNTKDSSIINYLQYDGFKSSGKDIMVRVQAINSNQIELDTDGKVSKVNDVEQAMVVGLNFETANISTTNVQPEVYDLTTATGITYWKNRLVLWGVPKDPTILFLSNVNEPGCFSYPNDIDIFDEPIVTALPFLDKLLVFTSSTVYQLTLNEDGFTWTSEVIQANLSISPWDRHLIKTVKNMIFFKSGNYYFMIVPKPQSLTGELALAPISNPLIEFFNHFKKNVDELLFDTYAFKDDYELINYYNFLDYEDMHNVYVFSFLKKGVEAFVHLDVLYNTSTRTWRIFIFEAPQIVYPYKQDSTQTGRLASTSFLDTDSGPVRIIQLYKFHTNIVRDFYVSNMPLVYTGGTLDITGYNQSLKALMEQDNTTLTFNNWQFLDTGFVEDNSHFYKRYREMQLMLNNIDGAPLEYGMEFIIDGQTRISFIQYEVEQVLDADDPNYGLMYLQAVPVMNLPVDGIEAINTTILGEGENIWKLDQSVFPDISIWRIRSPISGKGAAPRLRLLSKNSSRFELISVNWIYRIMNMR